MGVYMSVNSVSMVNYIDLCIMSLVNGELCILLTKRKKDPYKDSWALPGGLWDPAKSEDEAAAFQMYRKTNLRDVYMDKLDFRGGPARDPRGASVSCSYLILMNYDKMNDKISNSDEEEMKWAPVDKCPHLPFDHNSIVIKAKERIINQIRYTKVGFALVGESFTMNDLVNTFEKVIEDKIDASNLRKKLLSLGIIKKTNEKKVEKPGRPSPIYKLDSQALKKIRNDESFFRKG